MNRRPVTFQLLGFVAAATLVTGCIGDSDDAAYISTTSAVLRGHGKCNNSQYDSTHGNCYHYFQIREKGTSSWLPKPASSNCPTASAPSIDNGIPNDPSITWNLSCTWTNLAPNKVYEFQFCGNDAGNGAVCGSLRSFTTTTFANPVTQPCEGLNCFIGPRMSVGVGDPKVNAFDGAYYLTGSGWGEAATSVPQKILTSSDLINWTSLGLPTFTNAKSDGSSRPTWASDNNDSRNGNDGFVNIAWWASELHKVKLSSGAWKYVLVSSFDYDIGTKTQAVIGLATADAVTGPYTWLASPVDIPKSTEQHIDPSIFVDGSKIFLLHNVNGSAIASVQLDPATLARKANATQKFLLRSTTDPRNYEYDGGGDGREEGPGMIKAPDGTYVLYYATGQSAWTAPDSYQYTVGLARSATANGTFEKIEDAELPDGRLIRSTSAWKGAGHGGIVADASGRLWWVYHSTSTDDELHFRMTMVQQIFWDPSARWYFFENNQIKASDVAVPSH